jgi:hypothetical protein
VREIIWDQLKDQNLLLTELELALNALDSHSDQPSAAEERQADLQKVAQHLKQLQ